MFKRLNQKSLAQIQYVGLAGITDTCINALVRFIHCGDEIHGAKLLSSSNEHCFLLSINSDELVAIKGGFSSGYSGEGPRGLSLALQLLERHEVEIEEYNVAYEVIERINASCLLSSDIDKLEKQYPNHPVSWFDYIYEASVSRKADYNRLKTKFPMTIPFMLIDNRIIDLALRFKENPDSAITLGYKRLEDTVRERTGLTKEYGAKLFSSAFQNNSSVLCWNNLDPEESRKRGSIFPAIYMAYRNPRAHKELNINEENELREFLLLNELFLLEAESIERSKIVQKKNI